MTAPSRRPVVVIGSGAAGLSTALALKAHLPVLVVTKAEIADTNTAWAQGGIAAAMSAVDSSQQHFADTVAAGAGLVDEAAARVLCEQAPAAIAQLVAHGVQFDRADGALALAREAAHTHPRVLHAGGDQTGAEIERALAESSHSARVALRRSAMVTSILLENGRVAGVQVHGDEARPTVIEACAVVLATGGAGQLFAFTTNPGVATGDGVALAFQAGAEVSDLEFFQFHPTAHRLRGQRPFLISEAVRGEGAILRNLQGEAFMHRYHERAELAPRDIVARAIVAEMMRTGSEHVLLDCTHLANVDLPSRFPSIFAFCEAAGVDMRRQGIPVAPAAHYYMGGVRTDTEGRTTVPGLYACGEAASTGVHGANRLASNSLLESVVFAQRVARAILDDDGPCTVTSDAIPAQPPPGRIERRALQSLLWADAGIERSGEGLSRAAATIDAAMPARTPTRIEDWEDANLTAVGRLLVQAAVRRTESRGAHYRRDYPSQDDASWHRRQVFRRVE